MSGVWIHQGHPGGVCMDGVHGERQRESRERLTQSQISIRSGPNLSCNDLHREEQEEEEEEERGMAEGKGSASVWALPSRIT